MKDLLIETASGSYPVSVGRNIIDTKLLGKISELKPSSILIIADAAVQTLYGEQLLQALRKSYKTEVYVLPSGEEHKSFESFYDIQTYALKLGLDRKSLILAFGGGVIGDLAGFVAATYMRGIPFIQLPTTLLAHDSAVGGKVAINHPEGKNMIGAFYQPAGVIYDLAFLSTLPRNELRSGFAEVIKHGLIGNIDLFKQLAAGIYNLDDIDDEKLQHMIIEGIRVKAAVVKEDEKETGVRAHLNFGHTLGHAIEAEAGYGKISHGDGVAIGMLFAIWLSEKVNKKDLHYEKIKKWFKGLGFPIGVPNSLPTESLIIRMLKDKKSHSGTITMVLLNAIGEAGTSSFESDQLRSLLEKWRQEGSD
ncbi:3-dehydroquinate synthase [Bacillus sp. UMB0893]|uniref:3-dehydroquinate synthase n=1 Tax=Bacillus sp. UMB0893 TaxID=2066053 RepID=UPI000C7798A4|nr:3-dehydroquinate synthase [Bacillus sp. UMB0893]PLR66760.1 3-dehydroquinate synthase [Bacillus sp. UMB0893]